MPSRDYILRLIEQVGLLLRRVIEQRERNSPQEALQSVMAACERLFGMEAVQLFQFTPDQHFLMLTEAGSPEEARDKVLMYAALTAEAGRCYQQLNQPKLAQQAFLSALRLALKAHLQLPADDWPTYAPSITELLNALGDLILDDDTAALLAAAGAPAKAKP
ncbi:hypothetical protein [Opitutus terrae]|uniref:Uncharacterized protein n=1 Tax=Opitutus terrae (strain DSM 11246 / JCM 15787 / PB90-1) TaxID=452637 RepID=B1ZW68_OPITP|nr:hypothetical protein [Opitutus terrae]ACB76082.1 conserved hypothetical protein [Opitutus terrae PB90-1]